MYKILLALHLLFAIFAIGPLVHAATTAARGVRTSDSGAIASSARVLRIYAYVSVLVVLIGMGLMSVNSPDEKGRKVAQFSQTWIWLSVLLWLVSVGIVIGVLVPALTKATALVGTQSPKASGLGRVAVSGAIVGLVFAIIVFLMVYQPGH